MVLFFRSTIKFLEENKKFCLFALFSIHLFCFWPGIMTSDSQCQYLMAMSGNYGDHHPFIMSFLWRYIDKILKGSAGILVMHLSLFYSGIYFLLKSVAQKRLSLIFLGVPFIPPIFVYSGMIWKDLGFAYSFFCVMSYLAYLTMQRKNLSFFPKIGILVILAYGTLVKFQAQYLAPIVLVWIGWHCKHHNKDIAGIVKSISKVLIIFYGIISGIQYLGPKVKQDHSWQYVKLYDLSALSVELNQSLFPEFCKTKKFSMEKLHSLFNGSRVDYLVFGDAILEKGKNENERNFLWKTWCSQVARHPLLYIKHRVFNLSYTLISTPTFDYVIPFLQKSVDQKTFSYKILYCCARFLGWAFLAHFFPALLSCFYLIFGGLSLRSSTVAIPLFFMNAVSVGMLLALLFFSMAGTPRYTYICVCLVHASHVFAYLCWKKRENALYGVARRFYSNLG
ncbi:hypothetical protein [Holospora undulata]|uniref:Glycosyltransferase RgtA/B/C/D-like domain-containing protein n=1 Tax=Holospora undulata HU1 TaxID=1321371 RepID=A0A061JGN2_9PROT|nr:hypothetical protein [Holospora undulata]ETZ05271.1 hypothetical protein K737_300296 [Holospora undulata HU1]